MLLGEILVRLEEFGCRKGAIAVAQILRLDKIRDFITKICSDNTSNN